jgi:prepilin-type N-terminal cleavage/methylation domain-containing protein
MRLRRHGFTLIELVVAMALLFVLMALVLAGVGTFLQSSTAQQQEMLLEQNFRFATDTLSNDARQAIAITIPGGAAGNLYLDESIQFTTQDPDGNPAHTHTIQYSTEAHGTTFVLARKVDGGASQPVTEEIPQLLKVYFIKAGKKVFIVMVGSLTYYGHTRNVALSSLVFARNLGT